MILGFRASVVFPSGFVHIFPSGFVKHKNTPDPDRLFEVETYLIFKKCSQTLVLSVPNDIHDRDGAH